MLGLDSGNGNCLDSMVQHLLDMVRTVAVILVDADMETKRLSSLWNSNSSQIN